MSRKLVRRGEMTSRVTVEKVTRTRDDSGKVSEQWDRQTPDYLPCRIRQLGGAELVEAQALSAHANRKVEMDRWPGLNPAEYRLQRYGNSGDDSALEIFAIQDHEERGEMLIVTCGERLS